MTNEFTHEVKRVLYDSKQYVFEVPPVCTRHWSRDDWIKWIDMCNGWRPGGVA